MKYLVQIYTLDRSARKKYVTGKAVFKEEESLNILIGDDLDLLQTYF